jgi:hypothetical protein
MKQQPQLLLIFQHTRKDLLVKTSVGHAFHFVTNCWFWFLNISKDQGATSYSFLKKNIRVYIYIAAGSSYFKNLKELIEKLALFHLSVI